MTCRISLSCAMLIAFTLFFNAAFGQEAVLRAKPVCSSAVAGIPVVVGLTYHNPTTQDVSVPVLIDDYVFFVQWHWKSPNGDSYRLTVKNLHHSAIPSPGIPPRVTLRPGEERTWFSMVPTPKSFGREKKWELEVTVIDYDPRNPPKKETSLPVSFSCRNPKNAGVLDSLGFSLAQAAVIRPASQVLSEQQLQLVHPHHDRGDLVATLILFSDAIYKKEHVSTYWTELDDAPAEAKCLRNCLLSTASGQRRWTLPEDERQDLLQAIGDEDGPFIEGLRKNLQRPTRP